MGAITLQQSQRLTTLLSGAIKGMFFYPPGHPSIMQPIQEITSICHDILMSAPELRLGVVDGTFFIEEHLFLTPNAATSDLAERLSGKSLHGITIFRDVSASDLVTFIRLLASRETDAPGIEAALRNERITSIALKVIGTEEEETTEETSDFEALETYGKALEAIRSVITDIEKGRIPSSSRVITVVKNLVTLTIQDPSTLLGLSMIKDYDNYTFNHSVNVGVLSMALSASLGMSREHIEEAGIAGFLHDVGKTTVSKEILNKPGKLSAAEFELMKSHPENGAKIVEEMEGIGPQVAQAILGHHIRYNRRGYPEWARKLSFDTVSEVVAVADCYDAITTLRVYQHPLNPKAAIDELHRLAGNALNPRLVTRFTEMMGKYPVGTLVRLDNNEIAVVFRPNPTDSEAPTVKVIMGPDGAKLDTPVVRNLADTAGTRYATIVTTVDPLLKNISVGSYLV